MSSRYKGKRQCEGKNQGFSKEVMGSGRGHSLQKSEEKLGRNNSEGPESGGERGLRADIWRESEDVRV